MVPLIGATARQQCPCGARHFVCQRNGDYVCWSSLNQLVTPLAFVLSSGDHCSRAMNQERAHIRISSFADSAQTHLPASATLSRHQSKEGRQFASRFKARRIANRCHQSRGGQRPNARNFGNRTTGRFLSLPRCQSLLKFDYLVIEMPDVLKLITQCVE